MNVDLLIKENKELIKEKQRYKEMWFTANNSLAKYRKLEQELGCPLEVRLKVTHNTSIYDVEGNEYIVSHIDKEVFEVYAIFYMTFRWEHYKKTWWLKESKEE